MLTGPIKVMTVFLHLLFCSIFVLGAFTIFGEQTWLPNWFGVVIMGVAGYILFVIGCIMMMEYFDERGEFYRYDDEEED